jgi:Holliday junction resolvase
MSVESNLQSEILRHLRSKGCFAMKCSGSGVPTGTSDIFFCIEGFYGFIEVKRSEKAPFQPLQEPFLEKINEWSWAKAVWPENWLEVKYELEGIL